MNLIREIHVSIGSYGLECDIHVSKNFSLLDSSQVLEEQ